MFGPGSGAFRRDACKGQAAARSGVMHAKARQRRVQKWLNACFDDS